MAFVNGVYELVGIVSGAGANNGECNRKGHPNTFVNVFGKGVLRHASMHGFHTFFIEHVSFHKCFAAR